MSASFAFPVMASPSMALIGKQKKQKNKNFTLSPLSMTEGEQFNVLEGDNEGWTLVQRLSNGEEGFVPSSFLVIS